VLATAPFALVAAPFALSLSKRLWRTALRQAQRERWGSARRFDKLSTNGWGGARRFDKLSANGWGGARRFDKLSANG
jgi:hypothetical protein